MRQPDSHRKIRTHEPRLPQEEHFVLAKSVNRTVCPSDTRLHVQSFDIESGCDTELLNLNPDGWVEGVSNERNWRMLYGMDVSWHRNLILAGDSHGIVHAVDPRANKAIVGNYHLHKKGNKVRMQWALHCTSIGMQQGCVSLVDLPLGCASSLQ